MGDLFTMLSRLSIAVLGTILASCQAFQVYTPRRISHALRAPPPPPSPWGPASCMMLHCAGWAGKCVLDEDCRAAMECNAKCGTGPTSLACDLECELSVGYNSTIYKESLQCMADHKCLPTQASDGKCLANDTQTLQNLTSVAQIPGKWWILRGLNCGQDGWPAGFDYFPCQRDEFVPDPTDPTNKTWIDHIAYCGGTNNTCTTPMLYTVANVSMTSPGVMTHYYTDPPLTPQTEEWRVLSWPHPDWMLYIYCGETPTGPYAGGSVVSRTARRADEIPEWIEDIFVAKAK